MSSTIQEQYSACVWKLTRSKVTGKAAWRNSIMKTKDIELSRNRINPDSRSTRTDLIAATDFSGVGFNDLFCRSLMSLIVWFLLTVHFSRGILVV